MSSAATSLFVSALLAAFGAAVLAYTLEHPGVAASFVKHLAEQSGIEVSKKKVATVEEPAAEEKQEEAQSAGTVSIPAGDYGHFQTQAEINGRPVDLMVDTGASLVALTYEDASTAGIIVRPSDFTDLAQTANGMARVAPVNIARISIGDITVRYVPGVVSERGKSERTLLGMSFLSRLSRVEMRAGTLVLQE